MPICEKCGEDKPARGFSIHYKNCKGTNLPKQEKPPKEELKNNPIFEKKPDEGAQAFDARPKTAKEKQEEPPKEEPPKDYSGIIAAAIIFIVGILAFFFLFKLPAGDDES